MLGKQIIVVVSVSLYYTFASSLQQRRITRLVNALTYIFNFLDRTWFDINIVSQQNKLTISAPRGRSRLHPSSLIRDLT